MTGRILTPIYQQIGHYNLRSRSITSNINFNIYFLALHKKMLGFGKRYLKPFVVRLI